MLGPVRALQAGKTPPRLGLSEQLQGLSRPPLWSPRLCLCHRRSRVPFERRGRRGDDGTATSPHSQAGSPGPHASLREPPPARTCCCGWPLPLPVPGGGAREGEGVLGPWNEVAAVKNVRLAGGPSSGRWLLGPLAERRLGQVRQASGCSRTPMIRTDERTTAAALQADVVSAGREGEPPPGPSLSGWRMAGTGAHQLAHDFPRGAQPPPACLGSQHMATLYGGAFLSYLGTKHHFPLGEGRLPTTSLHPPSLPIPKCRHATRNVTDSRHRCMPSR